MRYFDEEEMLKALNGPVSPAVLAGILGISVPMVYQGRQDGKLPPATTASYLQCVHHYIEYHKRKSTSKASSAAEAKLLQDIRNGMAKEEMQWLEIKEKRQNLLDVTLLSELFIPIFQIVQTSLSSLARENPLIQPKIDQILESWQVLGEKLAKRAGMDADMYVQTMLEKDIELPEIEDAIKNRFGLEGVENV